MPHLRTARLELKPFTQALAQTVLEDRDRFADALGVRVPSAWPGPDLAEALPFFAQEPSLGDWSVLLVHTEDGVLVGEMGFKGGPDAQGDVELGYSLIPAYRGQGLTSEAAAALVPWALRQPGVRGVIAECALDNAASIGVLRRVGFVQFDNDGTMLRWRFQPRRR